ncbi:hypothetical protein A5906_09650 [Bradyrhizobium sacchari]|uniref:Uncharacterized protein n=1 Tax=Bradyrhizobium sacchari TaxID=1399419 RepID=A0A560K8U8_9BRAD|nr:hypothetical protein [Bradyrhizobium sacchari]OPY95174.1 hypothetical protein A5906_09650 [Bradyrhizobium sacchari]TWB53796.1 hypothetical protein FBZ94_10876 [Bradyrhizobium sacchari]TWB78244.1 hypothetical protein FBZ95_10376 [Bradyrhizobium sacchari]
MADHNHLSHARNLAAEFAAQTDLMRQLVAEAAKVLQLPVPDTFLGRKTQEPFPWEKPRFSD